MSTAGPGGEEQLFFGHGRLSYIRIPATDDSIPMSARSLPHRTWK